MRGVNCNIGVKQGFSFSPTLFGIYIDKLEKCLEEAGCTDTILDGIVIILLLYADEIVLMEMCPSNLDKQLRILKYLNALTWVSLLTLTRQKSWL